MTSISPKQNNRLFYKKNGQLVPLTVFKKDLYLVILIYQ